MKSASFLPVSRLGFLVAVLAFGSLGLSSIAEAVTFTVNSSADTPDTPVGGCAAMAPNTCTFRGAIQAANAAAGADTIAFAASITGGNVAVANSDYPVITGPVSINGLLGGTGTTRFTVDGSGTDGSGSNSLLRFTGSAGSYSVSNLIVTKSYGDAVLPATLNGGGGIFFSPTGASTLSLTNVDLVGNFAAGAGDAAGGGLYLGSGHAVTVTGGTISGNSATRGAGIYNAGSNLTMSAAVISGNTATGTANVDGGGIHVGAGQTVAISGGTISGNTATRGGGVYNFGASLSISDVVITGNTASGVANVAGGGIYSELESGGSTTLNRVAVTNNTAASPGVGGGIYARKVLSNATFSIQDSTIDNNTAATGAGGGLYVKRGLVQVVNSTVSRNKADNNLGGGIYLDSEAAGGRVAVSNSTISGNSADIGGGIGINKDNIGLSSMVHTTLAENTAAAVGGGGGVSFGAPSDGGLNPNLVFPGSFGNAFTSNILVKNTASGSLNNCRDAFSHMSSNDSGYNVSDDASCGFNQTSDRAVASPAPLGPLADNLGTRLTHALLAGNPAIDHANPLYVTATDQRGAAVQDGDQTGGAFRDAGSYEFGGFGVMQFDVASYTVREDTTPLTAVVKRYGNLAAVTSVKVSTGPTVPVSATAPADYVSISSQNVPFVASDDSENVSVTINDDDVYPEVDEQFKLLLFAPQKGSDLGPRDSATVTITDVEEGAFQFAQATYSVTEGGTAALNENGVLTISVTRASGSDKAVTVNYSVVAGAGTTAVAGQDYVAASATGSLSWADGETGSKTFDLQLIDDIKDETGAAPTLTLGLTDPPGRARLGTPATTVITINDDDPTPTVTLAVSPTTFSENAGTATVTATLPGSTATAAVTVNLGFSGLANRGANCGTAQSPADYNCSASAITIPAGQTFGTVTLTAIQDVIDESDETVIIDITSTSANAVEDGIQTVTATISEVTAVRGDFSLSSATYTAMEANGTLAVTVNRKNGDDGAASVQCATTDGTATSPADFSATVSPATLTWAADTAGPKTCTITLVNDSIRESNKSFTVRLTNASGAPLSATEPTQATVTLVSDEKPRFQFNLATTTVQEGTVGFQVTVEPLEAVNGEPLSIPYFTADGTATTADMDYTETTGSLTWNNGEAGPKSFAISMITSDGVVEGNETFTVNLGTPVGGAEVVGENPVTITIVDPPAVRYKSANFASINEQNGSTINTCVERVGSSQGAISVEYAVNAGTATEGVDYTPPPGTPMHVLNWANNDVADKCFAITIIGDTVDEPDETISLSLLNPSAGVTIGAPHPAQATITDDDAPPSVSLSLSPTTIAEEGAGNSATLTAILSGTTSSTDVTVNLAYSGVAENGTDYDGAASITVPAGQVSVGIALTAIADSIDEGAGEGLTATIASVSANATIGTPASASATITDNDSVTVAFSAASQTVAESVGTVTVTATRTGATTFDITIPYTVSGTAANPADHNAANGSITILAGNASGTATFTAVDDALDENNETVVFTMGTPTGGDVTAAAPTVHTVTITDNDTAGVTVTQSAGSTLVTEGGSGDSYTLVLTSMPTANVTITLNVGSQLTASPLTATFTPANYSTAQTISVNAVNDAVAEGTHSGTVTHSAASSDSLYSGISIATVTATIFDNDFADVEVIESGGNTDVSEDGATDTISVRLTSQPTANVTITANYGSQLSVTPASVTFTPGNYGTLQTFTIAAVDDNQVEGTHTATLGGTVSSADPNYNGSLGTTTVTITDNDSVTAGGDAPAVVVTPSGGAASGSGGGSLSGSALVILLGLLVARFLGVGRFLPMLGLFLTLLFPLRVMAQDSDAAPAAEDPAQAEFESAIEQEFAPAPEPTPVAKPVVQSVATPKPQPVKSTLSYDHLDLRYLMVSVKDPSVNAKGYGVTGSWGLGKKVYFSGGYGSVETDEFSVNGTSGSSKTDTFSLGIGWHGTVSARTDFVLEGSLLFSSATGQGGFEGDSSDTGFGLEAGWRGLWARDLEWGAGLAYVSVFGDSDTSLALRSRYAFSKSVALLADAGFGSNSSYFGLGVGFNF